MTVSRAWATPLEAKISAMTTVPVPKSPLNETFPSATLASMISPPTVLMGPVLTSAARTLPAMTWRRRTFVRASLSARSCAKTLGSILSKAALLGARTVNGPAVKQFIGNH